jgi:hypothetical protein
MATTPTQEEPEALEWLRQIPPPFGVCIHKALEPVTVGIKLVETLYALGARRVTVPGWAVSTYPATARHGGRVDRERLRGDTAEGRAGSRGADLVHRF